MYPQLIDRNPQTLGCSPNEPGMRSSHSKISESYLIALITKSDFYREYECAFVAGTGLPLTLHAPNMITVIRHAQGQENPFCALMSKTSQWATASYLLQRKVEKAAFHTPKTFRCFAGLCETTVPVSMGNGPIAYLQTGQILLKRPTQVHFDKIVGMLKMWNSPVNLEKAEEAWFSSRVITSKQYEALVRLLDLFAHQLATCSNALVLDSQPRPTQAISKACTFIREHCDEGISLAVVARIANMSTNYFSGKFAEATGMNFIEYVTRTRVEKACKLLLNPDLRISEIAYEVGFQSLSQFNRGFKQVRGMCPRAYRDDLLTI